MTQEEIEIRLEKKRQQQSLLYKATVELDREIGDLKKQLYDLDDPHALIPNDYNTLDEWLNGHPSPNFIAAMVFKNKSEARDAQLCCNTYQDYYHIVRHIESKLPTNY